MNLDSLLNNLEAREEIKRNVDSAVASKHTIESEREHLRDIASLMKEKYDLPTSEFNRLVDAAYNKEKLEEQKVKIDSTLEAINLLYNQ